MMNDRCDPHAAQRRERVFLKDMEVDELKKAMEEVLNKGIYINEILYKNIVHSINTSPEEKKNWNNKVAMELTEREKNFFAGSAPINPIKKLLQKCFSVHVRLMVTAMRCLKN
jgi:hypothetical protein